MEQTEKGRYIIFEGGENVGKTTAVEKTQKWLNAQNVDSVIIQEPYDEPIVGGLLDELLHSDDSERNFHSLDNWQQAFLFNAARRGIAKKVAELTKAGQWVLSSRSFLSTSVYQGYRAGIDVVMSGLAQMNRIGYGVEGGKPDMVFVLDGDPQLTIKRINSEKKVSILDAEKLEFHHDVRLGYLFEVQALEHQLPYIEGIDAEQTEAKVLKKILRRVAPLLSGYPPYKLSQDTRLERNGWLEQRIHDAIKARDRDLGQIAISEVEKEENSK